MATINLGNLTFTHKGDYAGGTAYVKNDIVYYATNGNSYIAKTSTTGNAPTSTAHWDLFIAGASGIWNAGLSLGTAGQVVKVNTGASALEFGDMASGGVVQFKTNHGSTSVSQATTSSSSFQDVGLGMSVTITPTSTNNKILIYAQGATQASGGRTYFTINKAGDSSGNGDLHTQLNGSGDSVANIESNSPDGNDFISMFLLDDNINSTNALTYKLRFRTTSGDTHFGVASSVPIMYAVELDSGVL